MPGIITQQRGNTGSYSNDESTSFLKFTKFILRMLVYFFKFLLGYNYFYWYSLFYWCFWTVMLEKTLESPSDCKEILNIHLKDWCWSWSSNSLATCCKELTHWKRPWCWERLKAGGERDNSKWDGWMVINSTDMSLRKLSEGQGSLACCSPCSHKALDTTQWLNNNNNNFVG